MSVSNAVHKCMIIVNYVDFTAILPQLLWAYLMSLWTISTTCNCDVF